MRLTKNQITIILNKLKQYIDKYMGNDGITPHIDESTKHWFIGDTDTGILAEGTSGDNGITPHIDESTKHWFIGDTDTGIVAEGKDGEGSSITVDSAMSSTSTNPVQNKVIKAYVDNKEPTVDSAMSSASTNPVQNKVIKAYVDGRALSNTVDEAGSTSLLSSPVNFTTTPASTNGTGVATQVSKSITLKESITNYDYIDIYIRPSGSMKRMPQVTRLKVSDIAFNNSTTMNRGDGSYIAISFHAVSIDPGAYGGYHFVIRGWFKTNTTFYIDQFVNAFTDSAFSTWQIVDIVGVKDKNTLVDLNVYSTAETIVGKWINGKPIYQKTINFGALPNASATKSVPHGVSNVDTIWIYDALASNSTYVGMGTYCSSSIDYAFYINKSTNSVCCESGNDRRDYSAYVTIRYTKTTD